MLYIMLYAMLLTVEFQNGFKCITRSRRMLFCDESGHGVYVRCEDLPFISSIFHLKVSYWYSLNKNFIKNYDIFSFSLPCDRRSILSEPVPVLCAN